MGVSIRALERGLTEKKDMSCMNVPPVLGLGAQDALNERKDKGRK